MNTTLIKNKLTSFAFGAQTTWDTQALMLAEDET